MATCSSKDYFPLEFVNMNVIDAPMMKNYYWESMDISGFNKVALQITKGLYEVVYMKIPPMPINSRPMKIILHMLNLETHSVDWSIKRVQLCDCKIVQVPVGISKSRNIFNCPHRDLITVLPISGEIQSAEIEPIVLNITYGWLGESILAYELTANENFKIQFNFIMNVFEFDPSRCILTKSLLPTCILKTEYAIQPIWFHNPHNHEMNFIISTEDKKLKIVENVIDIPSGAICPLLVQFCPNSLGEYEILFTLEFMGIKTEFKVKAVATNMFIPVPSQYCPKTDISTPDAPYTIYRNYLAINVGTRESINKMVVLHNQSDNCIAYTWKCNNLEGYYSIKVTPQVGSCKPRHCVACLVHVKAGSIQSVFNAIHLSCEIHRFTNSDAMNSEVESLFSRDSSLDEEKTIQASTFITRIFLNVNLRVNALCSLDVPQPRKFSSDTIANKKLVSSHFDRNIFDKLFWSFIYNEEFICGIIGKKCDKSYEDVIKPRTSNGQLKRSSGINKSIFIEVLQSLTAQAIDELSKKWRFIPEEVGKIS